MTHTPGPYHITRNDDRTWIEACVGVGIARLAIIDDGAGTQPGNADLFAAAPDMLDALKAIVEEMGTIEDNEGVCPVCGCFGHGGWCWYEQMIAAIDKAEGRTA